MPFLHAHRRRVPPQNVDRSIVVGIGTEAAVATGKDRLAFAALAEGRIVPHISQVRR